MERDVLIRRSRKAAELSDRNSVLALVSSLKHGKERARTGLYFLEGVRMVSEAVAVRAGIEAIVVAPEMRPLLENLPVRWNSAAPVIEVGRRKYESAAAHFALKQGLQGIGVLVHQRWISAEDFIVPPGEFAVALSGVQDSGNVGTILRTCDAAGSYGAIIMGDSADPYGPATVRASVGSILTQRFVRTSVGGLAGIARRSGASMIGTSPWASVNYRNARYARPFILLMGNEAKGLSEEELAACDQVVSIPMVGRMDSLNVAVAAAVLMFEARFWDANRPPDATGRA